MARQGDASDRGGRARPAAFGVSLHARLLLAAGSSKGVDFLDRHERARHYAYRTLANGAYALAQRLGDAGVRAGDRVAIVLPTGPQFYEALFASLALGALAVPLYPPVRLGKLAEYEARLVAMLASCTPRLIVATAQLAPLLAGPARRARVPAGIFELPTEPAAANDSPADWRWDLHHGSLDDLALLQFSSGTTGMPKAAALTHRQIAANVDTMVGLINEQVPLPPGAKQHTVVSWLPLYHDMGLMGCLLGALTDQCTLALLPPEAFVARPALWLRAIGHYQASVSAAPNFAYSLCVDRIADKDLAGIDLSSWSLALNGAEGVGDSTMQRFAARFAGHGLRPEALTPVYGLAEATLAVTFSSPTAPWRTLQRPQQGPDDEPLVGVGAPLPGFSVRLLDEAGAPVRFGHVGHIGVRGPSVMAGYWGVKGLQRATDAEGWLATGDLGVQSNGELFVVGRSKDVLVINGRNHSPEALESAANEVAGVRRGCLVAVAVRPKGAATDAVVLLVETRVRGARARARLQAAISAKVAEQAGVKVSTVALLAPGTLPRTSSGKLRRAAAAEQFIDDDLRPPARLVALRLWGRQASASARRLLGIGPAQ